MSQSTAKDEKLMSIEEYLVFEEKSKYRHEFMDGEIYLMAGATRRHNLITSNTSRLLGNQLESKDCEVYSSDFRVKIRYGHNVYPDVVVACGEIEVTDNDTTLNNPIVIIEVLSKSTEGRDRGEKLQDYFKLESVKDYILVAQNKVQVEHYHRQSNNQWILRIYENLEDELDLDSIECKIPLKLIYLKVKFPALQLVKSRKKNGK